MSDPTATGPDGKKIVYRNGAWQPLAASASASAPASEPTATGPGGQKAVYREGKWQPWQPNFAAATPATPASGDLQTALDYKAEHDPRGPEAQSLKPSEFELSLGTGIVRLPARMIGAYKDITETAGAAAGGIAGWLGASDETAKGIHDTVTGAAAAVPVLGSLPSSERVLEVAGNVNKAASEATGVDLSIHQPQGVAGAIGETAGGLLAGPKLAAPAAERAAVAAAAPAAEAAAPAAAKTAAPTLPEMGANTTAAYDAARDAGITVRERPFTQVLGDTINAGRVKNAEVAKTMKSYPKVTEIENSLDELSRLRRDFSFEEVDQVRRGINEAINTPSISKTERGILIDMKNAFDDGIDAMTGGHDYTAANMAPEEAAKLWKDARATATAEFTAQEVERAFGGDKTPAQILKQAQKWRDDPRRMRKLQPEDQELVRQMATVSTPEKLATLVSRFSGGALGSFLSFHFLGPVGAIPGAATAIKVATGFQRGRRAGALRDIVRGYGPEPTPAGAAAPTSARMVELQRLKSMAESQVASMEAVMNGPHYDPTLPQYQYLRPNVASLRAGIARYDEELARGNGAAIPEPAGMPPPQLPPATSPPVPWLALGAGSRPERQPPP
jgi:hypothetical protein